MPTNKVWTKEEEQQVYQWWKEGRSQGWIGEQVKRTRASIGGKLNRMGMTRSEDPAMWAAHAKEKRERAVFMRHKAKKEKRAFDKLNRPMPKEWGDEDVATLINQHKLGWTTDRMAKAFGTTRSLIAKQLKLRGLVIVAAAPKFQLQPPQFPEPTVLPVAVVPPPGPAPQPTTGPHSDPIPFLESRDGRCRFPLWVSWAHIPIEDKFVCGARTGDLYCAHHGAIMWPLKTRPSHAFGVLLRQPRNAA